MWAVLCLSLAAGREALGQEELSTEENPVGSENPLVVIVGMQECSKNAMPMTEEKTAAELRGLGFTVDVLGCEGKAEGESTVAFVGILEKIAEERGAVSAILILRSEKAGVGGADIWVADRVTKKTTFKRWTPLLEEDVETAGVIALKIVEILKVSFMELALPSFQEFQAPAPAPVEKIVQNAKHEIKIVEMPKVAEISEPAANLQPPSVSIESKQKRRGIKSGQIGLRLGGSVLGTPGSLGVLGAVEIGVRWNVLDMLAFEAEGLVTPVGRNTDRQNVSLTFSMAVVRVWLIWEPLRLKYFRLGVGPGGGVLFAWARGERIWKNVLHRDSTTTGYAGASIQAVFLPVRNFGLRLGFTAGSSIPRVSINCVEQHLDTFGVPIFEGFLGLELRLP